MRSLLILLFISLSVYSQKTESDLSLLPWPQKLALTEGVFILQKNFTVSVTGNPHPRILDNVNRFLRRLDGRTGLFLAQGLVSKVGDLKGAQLEIHCEQKGSIGIAENESYQLAIHSDKIRIDANSDIGALHGLETLLQLLDNESSSFYFPNVVITDYPRFKWRGLMIDAARHFQPVGVIKRNLDAMASMKMNVFHWHLADDQGWRIQLKKHPELVERASDGLFYTQEEIVAIVKYAEDRGIMVVPEIDVPGHASALLTAYPEIGSVLNYDATTYQIERNAGVFRPTLDPSNPKTYKVLASIFDEVAPLFRSPYFHIGGDENEGKDWDENPRIQAFKKKQGLANNHELQTYFTLQLVPMLKKHGKKLMGWEEIMDDTLPKEVVIHSWKGENEGVSPGSSLAKAAKAGYTTILSNGYYLDLMLGLATHYQVDPMEGNTDLTAAEQSRIIGGEAVMWSELVSSQTIDSRIWPRAAAVAERLWSDKSLRDISSLRKRRARY
jgi:hexosaminidase